MPIIYITRIAREVIIEGSYDWVSARDVLWDSREVSKISGEPPVTLAVAALGELLEAGLAEPGDLRNGFEPWPGTPKEILQRATLEFEELEKDPQGSGFWIANRQAGHDLAKEFLAGDKAPGRLFCGAAAAAPQNSENEGRT